MKIPVNGIETEIEDPQRHEFTVAVYTSVDRGVAKKNLARMIDARNRQNAQRGMRQDMAVVDD